MIHLEPGKETDATACSRYRWTHTYIAVSAGEVYEITPKEGSKWNDLFNRVSAAGYESASLAPFRRFRRVPDAPWFELIGAVGKSKSTTFRIGAGTTATMKTAGELLLYANDLPFMYWNNSGNIDVVVRRVR